MLFFLGFQTTRSALFWRGFGTSSSFRGMLFSPGRWFFRSVLLQQPQGTEFVEKCSFSVRGMVFPCPGGDCCFIASSRRQQNLSKIYRKMLFFSDFRRRVRCFFGVVLELARLSGHGVFPPGGDFFEAVLIAAAAATESVENVLFLSEAWFCPFPAREVIALLLLTTADNRICRKICRQMLFFLGFQMTRSALFWRGFGTSSSFRGMVFSPREVIFSKLFDC